MPLTIENPPPLMPLEDEDVFRFAREHLAEPPLGKDAVSSGPSGELRQFVFEDSNIHPDTRRKVFVYVPDGYRPDTPANLIVFQDGARYLGPEVNVPAVLENLFAQGLIPATVGVFIDPGDLKHHPGAERANRSLEYDVLGDAYAQLVIDEVLPRAIGDLNISTDPRNRAICGMSSGGIAAFTVAWERPDQFQCVISHCGSFTNLRGGGIYPSIVRMSAKKPLRIFLQSGNRDMDRIVGSWAVANHDMAAALRLKGYDYRFEFGNGGHTLHHGAAIFPQTLKWIWRESALR